ncbi:unnamed protein product [Lymnaea stagnalis]|uniref:Uncharacterized protein n=1 Tax=Lymnaea stagnalis TaxID=6523 RepID=A0AAV2IF35_LYMST
MPDHVSPLNQSATLIVVALLAFGLRPSLSSCENRCEQSIPSLTRLRSLWSRSFKRIGEQHVSFEQFLLSLVQASDSEDSSMRRLRVSLLRIIGRYQDCVMACEHQFSKRSGLSDDRRRALEALSKTSPLPNDASLLRHFLFSHPVLFPRSGRQITHVT